MVRMLLNVRMFDVWMRCAWSLRTLPGTFLSIPICLFQIVPVGHARARCWPHRPATVVFFLSVCRWLVIARGVRMCCCIWDVPEPSQLKPDQQHAAGLDRPRVRRCSPAKDCFACLEGPRMSGACFATATGDASNRRKSSCWPCPL